MPGETIGNVLPDDALEREQQAFGVDPNGLNGAVQGSDGAALPVWPGETPPPGTAFEALATPELPTMAWTAGSTSFNKDGKSYPDGDAD